MFSCCSVCCLVLNGQWGVILAESSCLLWPKRMLMRVKPLRFLGRKIKTMSWKLQGAAEAGDKCVFVTVTDTSHMQAGHVIHASYQIIDLGRFMKSSVRVCERCLFVFCDCIHLWLLVFISWPLIRFQHLSHQRINSLLANWDAMFQHGPRYGYQNGSPAQETQPVKS